MDALTFLALLCLASQVSELAGDPDHPGTIRNRQTWIPQAWREAEQRAEEMLQSNPLSYERTSSMFEDEVPRSPSFAAGTYRGKADKGLLYDLQAVVVHRGTASSGHYHASIRDCLKEVNTKYCTVCGKELGSGPCPSLGKCVCCCCCCCCC